MCVCAWTGVIVLGAETLFLWNFGFSLFFYRFVFASASLFLLIRFFRVAFHCSMYVWNHSIAHFKKLYARRAALNQSHFFTTPFKQQFILCWHNAKNLIKFGAHGMYSKSQTTSQARQQQSLDTRSHSINDKIRHSRTKQSE